MAQMRDLSNEVFGFLTALHSNGRSAYGSIIWLCKCDCGTYVDRISTTLVNGKSTSCGCKPAQFKDLEGQRFGLLIAISPTDNREYGSVVWKCICDCGQTSEASAKILQDGYASSCGCNEDDSIPFSHRDKSLKGRCFGNLEVLSRINKPLSSKSSSWFCKCQCGNTCEKTYRQLIASSNTINCGCKPRNLKPLNEVGLNKIYDQYRRAAVKRGYAFSIDKSSFQLFLDKNCHYCNRPPKNEGIVGGKLKRVFIYQGIDRVNNSIGYQVDNLVPCCIICNHAKDILTEEEFLEWIAAVYQHSIQPLILSSLVV